MTLFSITLILSLTVCAAGLLWRLRGWLLLCVEPPCASWAKRLKALPGALVRGLRGGGLRPRLRSLGRDVLLQRHVLRQSPVRWGAHFAIFLGFTFLLLFHAMDGVISRPVLPGYEPTLDPYQFLRNLLGALVLAGVLAALLRRLLSRPVRRISGRRDWIALGLVAVVIGSGFALEAVKITSAGVFEDMVEQYYPMPPEEELEALQHYWAAENGVIFPGLTPEPELVAAGAEINEFSCASCHSPTASAFVSRPLATALSPAAPALDAMRADRLLWHLHYLLFFLMLAVLPWSKFLHLATTPVNLLVRPRVAPTPAEAGPQRPVSQGLGLDACTHCGVCSVHCSVAPVFAMLGNEAILPSEKLQGLSRMARGELSGRELAAFAEGSFICTECWRCTELCPSHIDLQELWLSSKRELARREQAEPHGLMTRRTAAEWAAVFRGMPRFKDAGARSVNLTDRREEFWACVQCTTCTSVCPVVAAADDPVHELDLTPQQIMNLMRMGLKDLALGSRMVWSCVTCYKCQENCPQGIKVADVLYELRNIAAERLRDMPETGRAASTKGEWS